LFTWISCCSFGRHSMNLAEIWHMFRLSFRVLCTNPTSQKHDGKWLFLFLRITSLIWSKPSSVLACQWPHHYPAFEKPLKNCVYPPPQKVTVNS
jgi:hypothetical protein